MFFNIVGKANNLPIANPLSLNGVFDGQVPDFQGQFAKDADKGIMAKLKEEVNYLSEAVISIRANLETLTIWVSVQSLRLYLWIH